MSPDPRSGPHVRNDPPSSPSSFAGIYDTEPRDERPASSKRAADDGAGHGTAPKKLKQDTDVDESGRIKPSSAGRLARDYAKGNLSDLLHGDTCQACGRTHPPGLRIAWQLKVRMCPECLVEHTQTETDLMFSEYSMVLSAAPFAFILDENRLMSNAVLKRSSGFSEDKKVRKVYLTSTLKALKDQLDRARESSSSDAAKLFAELKETRGQDQAAAEKWEEWECQKDLESLTCLSQSPKNEAFLPVNAGKRDSVSNDSESAQEILAPAPVRQLKNKQLGSPDSDDDRSPLAPTKTAHDLEKIKGFRKYEIMKRCQEDIDPPLSPALLEYMEAYEAAGQIPQALTETAWNELKPRLLREKGVAQRKRQQQQGGSVSAASEQTTKSSNQVRPNPRDLPEHRSQENQEMVRNQLGEYADDVIHTSWQGGQSVAYQNAPKFAAQVLMQVRSRYYDENNSSPPEEVEKLTLGDMKWVYDHKVKSIAEAWRKELFLCNGCADKYRGFDSVNQHFAAKHPNDFGHYWQIAEWLPEPPFAPYPETRIPTGFKTPTNAGGRPNPRTAPPPPQQAGTWPNTPVYGAPPPMHGPYGMMNYSPNPHSQPSVMMNSMGAYGPPSHYPMNMPRHGSPPTNPTSFIPNPPYPMYIEPSSPAPSPYHPHVWAPPPPGSAYPAVPYPPQMPNGSVYGSGQPQVAPYPERPPSLYSMHTEEVAGIATHVWSSIGNVPMIPESVKAYTVIFHVVHDFQDRCSIEPNIDLFLSALLRPSLRSLRDLSSLACKTCLLKDGSSASTHPRSRAAFSTAARRIYQMHGLLQHFKVDHIEKPARDDSNSPGYEARGDWTTDMVELPSDRLVEGLQEKLEESKLAIVAKAFPHIFRMHFSTLTDSRTLAGARSSEALVLSRTLHSTDDLVDVTNRERSVTPRRRVELSSSPPVAGEDEYDPRWPAFIDHGQQQSRVHPSRADQGYAGDSDGTHKPTESRESGRQYEDRYKPQNYRGNRRRHISHAPEHNKWNKPPSHKVQPTPRSGDTNVVVKGQSKPTLGDQIIDSGNGNDRDFVHVQDTGLSERDFVRRRRSPQPPHHYARDVYDDAPEEQESLLYSLKDGILYRKLGEGQYEATDLDPSDYLPA